MPSSDRSSSLKNIEIDKISLSLDLSTQFFFGTGLEEEIRSFCKSFAPKAILIADSFFLSSSFVKNFDGLHFFVPRGEKGKTKKVLEQLIHKLLENNVSKDTILVALGGGSTLDLVGFLASIYLRGAPLVFIPTTLLAMVDASIGGKTGIDTDFGKNLIGTFYPPQAVFCDLQFLQTLSQEEKLCGLAEIAKIGLIYDASIWDLFCLDPYDRCLIQKAIKAKISIVAQDFQDRSLRRILNFGHTIGHALETSSRYNLPHGLAVALGSLVEAHIALELGYLSKNDFDRICQVYQLFPQHLKTYDRKTFEAALFQDKKRALGKLRFVLPKTIGGAHPFGGEYCQALSLEDISPSLAWMERSFCG